MSGDKDGRHCKHIDLNTSYQTLTQVYSRDEHVHIIKPLKKNHEENVKIFEKELAYQGLSVIIPTRECIVSLNKRMREKFKEKKEEKV